jgi:hypothetical protein
MNKYKPGYVRKHDIFHSVTQQNAYHSGLGGVRHELSSLTQTLESWVRIPFKAWMSVCVYSVFVLFCV